MKKYLIILFILFACGVLSGNNPDQNNQDPIREEVQVTNIEVPVRVFYKGRPVAGLSRDQFELYENNKRQPINGFFEKLVIIGSPKVILKVSADARLAHWIARLEDVHPDGRVSLVTGAVINGCLRGSRLKPEHLVPGEKYKLKFDLHFTTWTFRPGHRIRLAVSNALFPMIWPTPYQMTTSLYLGPGATTVQLPLVPPGTVRAPSFLPPQPREQRSDAQSLESRGWPYKWEVINDHLNQNTTVKLGYEDKIKVQEKEFYILDEMSYKTSHNNPADSSFMGTGLRTISLKGREIKLVTKVKIRSDQSHFHVTFSREIFENDRQIKKRTWKESVRRLWH